MMQSQTLGWGGVLLLDVKKRGQYNFISTRKQFNSLLIIVTTLPIVYTDVLRFIIFRKNAKLSICTIFGSLPDRGR